MSNDKQNNNAFNFFLPFIVSLIFIYLMASFAVWDLNPSHWSAELRGSFAFIAPCISLLVLGYSKLN